MTQREALTILKTGANVFLTGEPGSGKTHTVNAYVRWLRERGIDPAITASTGIAATHIGGMTIHSWSGIGIKDHLNDQDLDMIAQNKNVVKRVTSTNVLIIDEVSMLSQGTLSMVDAVCREVRRTTQPFGGMQVVLVGDFFQLPPVVRRAPHGQGMFAHAPMTDFAFESPAWRDLQPLVCYLSEQYRQEDPEFLELLLAIRRGACTEEHRAILEYRAGGEPDDEVTQLYAHNANVDQINERALGNLASEAKRLKMESTGPARLVDALKRGCLSPEQLELKEGARVMFTKNDHMRGRYVNGTLGVVIDFNEDGLPVVETHDGRELVAEPDEWRIEDGGRVLASIRQVPLRLAWAMTVHKSQGMSLDAAHMDLSRAFEYGQGYVALSRVRTLAGLSLAGFNERALEVHPEVLAKDAAFRAQSLEAREAFASMESSEVETMHANFVKACGGSEPSEEGGPAGADAPAGKKRKGAAAGGVQKKRSAHETLEYVRDGQALDAIAQERGLKAETILTHIKECVDEGLLSPRDIAYLAAGIENDIDTIHDACKVVGTEKLKDIFTHLEGAYPYRMIRLALLLYSREGEEVF